MPARSDVGIAGIRRLAKKRVEETSLRAVAAEVGMSYSGLRSFLEGREPYRGTRMKLMAWHARVQHPTAESISTEAVEEALALLGRYLASLQDSKIRGTVSAELMRAVLIGLEGPVLAEVSDAIRKVLKEHLGPRRR
ncbi:MAG: hypothetical protein WEG36_11085 [Gemmatimonadota bacterium]